MARKRKVPEVEYDLVEEAVDRLMDHPSARELIDQATSFFDGFGILIDRAADRATSNFIRKATVAQEETATRQRKYIERALAELAASRARVQKQPPKETPRSILGFGPTERLTVEKIKKRHRDFAKIVHPDKGGSSEIMARYNGAAEALLKEVKR